jgi:hypothetical protein
MKDSFRVSKKQLCTYAHAGTQFKKKRKFEGFYATTLFFVAFTAK